MLAPIREIFAHVPPLKSSMSESMIVIIFKMTMWPFPYLWTLLPYRQFYKYDTTTFTSFPHTDNFIKYRICEKCLPYKEAMFFKNVLLGGREVLTFQHMLSKTIYKDIFIDMEKNLAWTDALMFRNSEVFNMLTKALEVSHVKTQATLTNCSPGDFIVLSSDL